jgi:hypothetical protein
LSPDPVVYDSSMQEKRPWDARLLERLQREGREWERPVGRKEVVFAATLVLVVVILSIALDTFLWLGVGFALFYIGLLRARSWRTRRRGPDDRRVG